MKNFASLGLLLSLALPAAAAVDDELTRTAVEAALDDRDALYNLAVKFYQGAELPQSYAHAARLWQKAAALGSIAAKNNLGFLTYEGKGVARDQGAAVQLWREAAAQGHSESQVHLGSALFDGHGVASDRVAGLRWILFANATAAARSRDPDAGGGADVAEMAREELERMSALASAAELEKARATLAELPVK